MRNLQTLGCVLMLGISGIFLGLKAGEGPEKELKPDGKGIGTLQHPPMPEQAKGNPGAKPEGPGKPTTNNGITYHGGPVMTNTTHIYYIWYGDWTGDTATSLLPYLATNIGDSPYYKINTTYT